MEGITSFNDIIELVNAGGLHTDKIAIGPFGEKGEKAVFARKDIQNKELILLVGGDIIPGKQSNEGEDEYAIGGTVNNTKFDIVVRDKEVR